MGTIEGYDIDILENNVSEEGQNVVFSIGETPMSIHIDTTVEQYTKVAGEFLFNEFMNHVEKDYLYKAVGSLLKKTSYLQLSLQLEEGQIDEEEFDVEIENNPEKYINKVCRLKNANDLFVINEIVKKLRRSFSVDEVADLFSVTAESLESKTNELAILGE